MKSFRNKYKDLKMSAGSDSEVNQVGNHSRLKVGKSCRNSAGRQAGRQGYPSRSVRRGLCLPCRGWR